MAAILPPGPQGGASLVLLSVASGIGVGTVWTTSDALISALAGEGRLGQMLGIAGSFRGPRDRHEHRPLWRFLLCRLGMKAVRGDSIGLSRPSIALPISIVRFWTLST